MRLVLFLKHEYFVEKQSGYGFEYREVTPYWCSRLIRWIVSELGFLGFSEIIADSIKRNMARKIYFKEFDLVDLRDGYSKKSLVKQCDGITIKKGCDIDHRFCVDDKYYFVIKLKEIEFNDFILEEQVTIEDSKFKSLVYPNQKNK